MSLCTYLATTVILKKQNSFSRALIVLTSAESVFFKRNAYCVTLRLTHTLIISTSRKLLVYNIIRSDFAWKIWFWIIGYYTLNSFSVIARKQKYPLCWGSMPLLVFDYPDGTDVSQIKLFNFLHEKLRLCHAIDIRQKKSRLHFAWS